MPERRPLIAANWKMNKTLAEAEAFCAQLPGLIEETSSQVIVCPPFTALREVAGLLGPHGIATASQNMHFSESGAFTGEISPSMIIDAGATGAILGHSERRQLFGETDDALARKVPVALDSELLPILCVGETEEERDRDETESVLHRQIDAGLSGVEPGRLPDVVIAYEPIWAIGTGKTATPEAAEETIAHIRALVAERSAEGAEAIRILYGGSVKPANAAELLGREGIDGALVGGAALDPADFAGIVNAS
jgi:triosephosphate isomerase